MRFENNSADKRVGGGDEPGAGGPEDAADGGAGLHRHHRQPGAARARAGAAYTQIHTY